MNFFLKKTEFLLKKMLVSQHAICHVISVAILTQ